jgi:hypothetical protein
VVFHGRSKQTTNRYMKILRVLLLLAVSISTADLPGQTKAGAGGSGKTPITDLIIYDVILYDTAKAENVGKSWEGVEISHYNESVEHRYLNPQQSRDFRKEMQLLIKKKGVLFFDGAELKTADWVNKRLTVDVTIPTEDSLGNVLGTMTVPDSIDSRRWSKITFYEEWKLNKSNGMIEKSVLAYMFSWYNAEKVLWIPLFGIVRDKPALEKIKKLTGWQD